MNNQGQIIDFNVRKADLSLPRVVNVVKERAKVVYAVSDEEAKKLSDYQEINGDPSGGFKPLPGHCHVFLAAVSKKVNFVDDLKVLMNETDSRQIF